MSPITLTRATPSRSWLQWLVRTLGVLLEPFLPFASEKIRISLNVPKEQWTWHRAAEPLAVGHTLGPAPEVLFRKLDPNEFAAGQ